MAQLTIYLDAETEARMKAAAEAEGVSYSKWVSRIIQDRTRNDWPASVARLAGVWRDDPGDDDAPGDDGEDIPREPF